MKLKYYLRGLGMGILFATIIMAISSALHKNDISDEEIIKRAEKLGMVKVEATEDENGLWGSTENMNSEDVPSTESKPQNEESTQSEEKKEPSSEKKPSSDKDKDKDKDRQSVRSAYYFCKIFSVYKISYYFSAYNIDNLLYIIS